MATLIGGSKFQAAQIATGTGAVSTLSSLVNTRYGIFNAYSTINNSKNLEQDNRLTATETRLSSIEIDIEGVVSSVVTTQIAQTTFDTLRAELTNANSDLSLTLATKVAQTLQYELDSAQNSSISTVQANLDAYEASNDAAFGAYSTFNNQTVADNLSTFNAYVASNDAALSTAIADASSATLLVQNNLTDYETSNDAAVAANLSSFNAYVASNDAAFGAYSTFNNNTVSTLRGDFSTYSSFNNQVVEDNLSTFNAYVVSNDASLAGVSTLLVNYEATNDAALAVTNANHTAYVASNNAALAQVSTNLGVYESTNDATVADHYSTFNTYVASNNATVSANLSTFNAYVVSNDASVSANLSTFNAYVTSNNAAVNARVLQTAYNSKMTALDNLDKDYEERFIAVEEFIRALLATYSITKENGLEYNYTAMPQNMSIAPYSIKPVKVALIETGTAGGFGFPTTGRSQYLLLEIAISDYTWNTFYGSIQLTWPGQSAAQRAGFTITKANINAGFSMYSADNNHVIQIFISNNNSTPLSLDINDNDFFPGVLPMTISYINMKGRVVYSNTFSRLDVLSLPRVDFEDVTPQTPTNVQYNTITKLLTFSVEHPEWIDFISVTANGVTFPIQLYEINYNGTLITIDMSREQVLPTTSLSVTLRYDSYKGEPTASSTVNATISIVPPGFAVETPSDATYDAATNTLQFTIDHPEWIDFIDIVVDGNGSLVKHAPRYSVLGTTITINTLQLPQAPTTRLEIFVRYDKYTGNNDDGTFMLIL
jgi:hypothetical protein